MCEDIGTGYLALLVGAPSTIIDGFVNGGVSGPTCPGYCMMPACHSGEVFAGGLINPGSLGSTTILPGTLPTLEQLAERLFVSPLNDLGGLLGGLLDNLPVFGLPGLTSLTGSNTSSIASTENTLTPKNERLTVDVATDLGAARGKHAAPDVSFAAPLSGLPGQARAAQAAKDVVGVVDRPAPTYRDQTFGRDVAEAASQGRANGGTPVVLDSLSFVPETGKKSGGNSGGSNRAGATLSSTAKNFGDAVSGAVKGALGGGAKDGGSKDDAGDE